MDISNFIFALIYLFATFKVVDMQVSCFCKMAAKHLFAWKWDVGVVDIVLLSSKIGFQVETLERIT